MIFLRLVYLNFLLDILDGREDLESLNTSPYRPQKFNVLNSILLQFLYNFMQNTEFSQQGKYESLWNNELN